MNTLIIFAIAIAFVASEPEPIGQEFVSVNQDSLGNFNYKILTEEGSHRPLLRVAEHPLVTNYKIIEIPEVPLVRKSVEIPEIPLLRKTVEIPELVQKTVEIPVEKEIIEGVPLLRSELVEIPEKTQIVQTEVVEKVKTDVPLLYRTVPVQYVEKPVRRYVLTQNPEVLVSRTEHQLIH